MFAVNHLNGFNAGSTGGGPIVITNTANAVSGTDGTSITFSAQSFGTAADDRHMIVCYAGTQTTGDGSTITSMTIGGVSATSVVTIDSLTGGGGAHVMTAIWIAAVPTGTTGDVVINFSTTFLNHGISIFSMTGAASSTASSTNSARDDGADADAITLSVTIPSGGGGVGCYGQVNTGAAASCTWTGLTEAYDNTRELSSTFSTASSTTAGSPLSITATPAAAAAKTGCAAAWSS